MLVKRSEEQASEMNTDPFIAKQREAESEAAAALAGDVPPAYYVTSSSAGPSGAATSAQPERQRRPNIPPTNFLVIRRDSASLREAVVIDPGLLLPSFVFGGGEDGNNSACGTDTSACAELGNGTSTNLGTRLDASAELELEAAPFMSNDDCEGYDMRQVNGRKNLSVECLKGNINLDVWLVDGTKADTADDVQEGPDAQESPIRPTSTKRRAELDIVSKSGNITVDLNSTTAQPYALSVASKSGSVSLAIPSSFTGPVSLQSRSGTITLSPAVLERTVVFSDIDGRRACFIGDVRSYTGKDSWTGSIVDVSTKSGRVKLSFVDEEPEPGSERGFWGRLFCGR